VRGFVLTGARSQTTSDSLTLLERHWRQIDVLVETETEGAWMYAVTKERLRRIEM
jgi:hypothetical protein